MGEGHIYSSKTYRDQVLLPFQFPAERRAYWEEPQESTETTGSVHREFFFGTGHTPWTRNMAEEGSRGSIGSSRSCFSHVDISVAISPTFSMSYM